MNFTAWPLWAILALFGVSAAVIAVVGVRIARVADRLADVTGWGEAIFGAVLLGGATSLPGIVTSVTTAWQGHPELSVSNAVGGIAAQTAFLALADMSYRHANLEHAAASIENLVQGALLVTLLALPLAAMGGPEFAIGGKGTAGGQSRPSVERPIISSPCPIATLQTPQPAKGD